MWLPPPENDVLAGLRLCGASAMHGRWWATDGQLLQGMQVSMHLSMSACMRGSKDAGAQIFVLCFFLPAHACRYAFLWSPTWISAPISFALLGVAVSAKVHPVLRTCAPLPMLWFITGGGWYCMLSTVLWLSLNAVHPGPIKAAFAAGAMARSIASLGWASAAGACLGTLLAWLFVGSMSEPSGSGSSSAGSAGGAGRQGAGAGYR